MRDGTRSPRIYLLLFLAVAGFFCATGFSPVIVTPSDAPEWGVTQEYLAGLQEPTPPQVSAAAYIVVNPTTSRIVLSYQEHERRAPASLTKIMTYMTTMDLLDQQPEGGLTLESHLRTVEDDFYPYSAIGMKEDEAFALEDLLYILLVPSDNAAAVTIARSMSGSEDAFVQEMNALAAEWGLNDTRFVNAHGLDAGGQYASAYDLAILSRKAMYDGLFADIVQQVQVDRGGYRLTSTNELLSEYEGALGIKTGTTDEAGQCLIGWVKRSAGTAMTVVLGSSDRIGDSEALLDYFFDNYTELVLDLPRSALNTYRDSEGDVYEFTIAEPVTYLTNPWELSTIRYVRRLWNLPDDPVGGEQVGVLEVWMEGELLTELPLYVRYE